MIKLTVIESPNYLNAIKPGTYWFNKSLILEIDLLNQPDPGTYVYVNVRGIRCKIYVEESVEQIVELMK